MPHRRHRRSRTHLRLPAAALVAASVALAPAIVPAAAPAKAKGGAQFLEASVEFTSIITQRCPAIVGIDAWTTDVTTTVYRHSVSGTGPSGRGKGSMEIEGEQTYTTVRTVQGESDTIKPYTIGPTKRPFSTRTASWKGVVSRITAGRKKGRQQYASYLDFTGIDPTLDVQVTSPVPTPGQTFTYPLKGDEKKKGLTDQGGNCTATEVQTVTGSVTFGRLKKAGR